MKNAVRTFAVIAFVAIIGFAVAGCKGGGPVGTYHLSGADAWTITFGPGTFTMFVPAQYAPSGSDTTTNGSFTVDGKTVTLTGLNTPMVLTIASSTTLTESDGSEWKKR